MQKGKISVKTSKRRKQTERQYTPLQITEAIQNQLGSVTVAAKKLKCNRTLIYLYMKRYPEIQSALDACRTAYKDTCQELARDNHLTRLMQGEPGDTAYELSKMEPKPPGVNIDTSKLTVEELVLLKTLLDKARPDGHTEPA
ncbi:MAG: hypothetical protein ABIW76_17175 [Fibrobacteria bacterium]